MACEKMKFDPSVENFFTGLVWYSRDCHSQMPPFQSTSLTLPNDLVYGLV